MIYTRQENKNGAKAVSYERRWHLFFRETRKECKGNHFPYTKAPRFRPSYKARERSRENGQVAKCNVALIRIAQGRQNRKWIKRQSAEGTGQKEERQAYGRLGAP